ncbi:MAG TPA: hypothetical protein VN758_09520 [Solirubrobacterales bacterium]|nr:hypothetical protein [Solirubrobacterales bacterium]
MVIADVGQGVREEVDFAPSPASGVVGGGGTNYGWSCREGTIAYSGAPAECGPPSDFTEPVFDYPHTDPGNGSAHGCSIIGGYVVRDPSLGDLYGRYLYSDFCAEEIRSLALPSAAGVRVADDYSEGLTVGKPSSFGEDACGRLYVASGEGGVYRFTGATPRPCPPAPAPDSEPVAAPTGRGLGIERKREALRLDLRGQRRGIRLRVAVEAAPCAGQAGDRVQLNRGGKRLGSKRLDDSCVARFFVRVEGAATFRALLLGSEEIRSPRLSVEPHRPGTN